VCVCVCLVWFVCVWCVCVGVCVVCVCMVCVCGVCVCGVCVFGVCVCDVCVFGVVWFVCVCVCVCVCGVSVCVCVWKFGPLPFCHTQVSLYYITYNLTVVSFSCLSGICTMVKSAYYLGQVRPFVRMCQHGSNFIRGTFMKIY